MKKDEKMLRECQKSMAETVWEKAKLKLKERIDGDTYRTWVEPLRPVELNNGNRQMCFIAPDTMESVLKQDRFWMLIEDAVFEAQEEEYDVGVLLEKDVPESMSYLLEL